MFRNLYIHVPFCLRKCDYCAFYSIDRSATELRDQWLKKMAGELERHSAELQNLNTIFFGGGTPSSLSCEQLTELNRYLHAFAAWDPDAEITMEVNPETVTPEKAGAIAAIANRVSMGVQSFSREKLKTIGRHTADPEQVFHAVDLLRTAGIRNLGFDLIYAVPGETEETWKNDLDTALSLHPDHLSAYALIPEDGTPLVLHGLPKLPDDTLSRHLWDVTEEILTKSGLPRYEISNYANICREARHNQNVWHGQSYLGLGPAASSFDGRDRWTEVPNLGEWLNGAPPETDRIPAEKRRAELLFMGLRTVCGWQRDEYVTAANGYGWDEFLPKLNKLERSGLLHVMEDRIVPTTEGLAFWNDVALELL